MGFLDNIQTSQEIPQAPTNLHGLATSLLKRNGLRKRTRRGSGKNKKLKKQNEHDKNMQLYRLQKKQRGQMFRDFERLIAE